jgi:hypothetical protein
MKIPTLWLSCGDVDMFRKGHYLHGEDDTGQHWLMATEPDHDCCRRDKLTVRLPLETEKLNEILVGANGLILTGTRGDAIRLRGK